MQTLDRNAERDTAVLVADIGGTHARLGIARADTAGTIGDIAEFRVLHCAHYPDLETLLDSYLRDLAAERPHNACLAIAGPNDGTTGTITNTRWQANGVTLAQRFGFARVRLLNDFGALAYSVPWLQPRELIAIHAGTPAPRGPISVIGPGTGFGVALLVAKADTWEVITTEGGHRSFAPTTRRELQLCEQMGAFDHHLCVEHLLSGSGISNIYHALATLAQRSETKLAADEISGRALAGSDALCVETIALFCNMLGGVAGDVALTHGATGGVYLGGGILPKILPLFETSDFFKRFTAKGVMSGYLTPLPVNLIKSDDAALKGAALWFLHHGQE